MGYTPSELQAVRDMPDDISSMIRKIHEALDSSVIQDYDWKYKDSLEEAVTYLLKAKRCLQ